MTYYGSVVILLIAALGVLCVLVRENARLSDIKKQRFYLSYLLLALAITAEWLGVRFSGNAVIPAGLLRAVKCADYILTPLAGGSMLTQLRGRRRWHKLLLWLLAFNTVFQLVSAFTGWMIRIDEQHNYSHGSLYWVYIVCYLTVIGLVVAEFISYGRRFRRQNRLSIYAILVFVILGVAIQEIFGSGHRTAYIALTLGMSMMYIHYTEFTQLAADEHIHEQQILITTDALTGVLSRHAYADALRRLDAGKLPEDLTVFSIDINGLKQVNDNQGHEAGDELICGAADCIMSVFEPWGNCYRTGGDEFIVLARMRHSQGAEILTALACKAREWRGNKVSRLSLSAGCACASDHPALGAEKLVGVADQAMYATKAAYYRSEGIDRRRRSDNEEDSQKKDKIEDEIKEAE